MEENICCKYKYSPVQKKHVAIFQPLPVAKPDFKRQLFFSCCYSIKLSDTELCNGGLKKTRNTGNLFSTDNLRSNSPVLQIHVSQAFKDFQENKGTLFPQELFRAHRRRGHSEERAMMLQILLLRSAY